jgi:acyl-CoA thioester hydrolase
MEQPASGARRLVHVEAIPMRWGDMDAMGHVNNTVYFRYMEQARIAWFDRLMPERGARGGLGIVVVSSACNFRKPLAYPGTVEMHRARLMRKFSAATSSELVHRLVGVSH